MIIARGQQAKPMWSMWRAHAGIAALACPRREGSRLARFLGKLTDHKAFARLACASSVQTSEVADSVWKSYKTAENPLPPIRIQEPILFAIAISVVRDECAIFGLLDLYECQSQP
jgi:hypothetical protein